MSVFIYDAVRTVRGKAKPDGGLASQKPEDLVAAAAGAIAERMSASPPADALVLGAVGQVGAQGGNIALVQAGDMIRIDIPQRSINVLVSDAVLQRRRAAMEAKGLAAPALLDLLARHLAYPQAKSRVSVVMRSRRSCSPSTSL